MGKPRWRPEHGERTVARLEAFSDIVIGFALAQTTLVLVLPPHAIDILRDPVTIFGFVITYFFIASFWWNHHRVFTTYFVPERLPIALNFAALAAQSFSIFALQMWLHFAKQQTEAYTAARIYFASVSIAFALLSLMQGYGIVRLGAKLEPAARRYGARVVIRRIGMTVGILIGVVISGYGTFAPSVAKITAFELGPQLVFPVPQNLLICGALGLVVGGVISRAVVFLLDRYSTAAEVPANGAT